MLGLLDTGAPGVAAVRPPGWYRDDLGHLPSSASISPSAGAQLVHRALERLRTTYSRMHSVHAAATARISVSASPLAGGSAWGFGRFELWASAERYRLSSHAEPRLGLAGDVEVAFDGQTYQLLLGRDGVLSRQTGDPRVAPTALPNPLLLPVSFLERDGDDCPSCVLMLSEVGDPARWQRRLARAGTAPTSAPGKERAPALLLPGKVHEGVIQGFRVWAESIAGQPRIARIETLSDSEGRLVAATDLRAWRLVPALGSEFPFEILQRVYGDDGQTRAEVLWSFTTLEINTPLSAEAFAVPEHGVDAVWNVDLDRFDKHWQLTED